MNIKRATVQFVFLAVVGLAMTAAIGAQSTHILVPADKLQWGPAPPSLPAGADISVLEGNPAATGPVTLRLRFPANYDLPPHWHSMTERVTVLTGSLHVGMGDTLDREKSQTLEPGGFVSLPARMHHFAWTATPTIVQINLEGPFDIFYVRPGDDPQKRQSSR
jgi:hypothetical protein